MGKWDGRKAELQKLRARIDRHLHNLEDTLDSPAPKDTEDRASERQGDEVLEALGQTELAELRMIDAALARIEAGNYGICTVCEEEISQERLNLLPYTPVCKLCAK